MNHFFDNLKRLVVGKVLPGSLNRLTEAVSTQLQEARQKLLSSDGAVKTIARACIEDAEDCYQEAIYALKEGSVEDAFQYCKKSKSFLSLANFHLNTQSNLRMEPSFKRGSSEDVVQTLAHAIAQFKSVIEYTNCELDKDEHDRYMEVVRLFYRSTDNFADGNEIESSRLAYGGLLWIYYIGGKVKERTGTQVISNKYLKEFGAIDMQRIVDLIDLSFEARREFLDASEQARLRTNQYLAAASNTIEQSIYDYMDGNSVEGLVKAGKMEVRMAKRLIESSFSSDDEPLVVPDEESAQIRAREFKERVSYLKQFILENDSQELRLVRRLQQVSAYYGMALKMKEEGSLSEAERYARSCHLDIDYARQLFSTGDAMFSDTI